MSVWLAIPSARPHAEAAPLLARWRERGYSIALWRDPGAEPVGCDLLLQGEYPGYAQAVNALAKEVLARDPDCSWIVTGGDDVEPDPNKTADEIARECSAFFAHRWHVGSSPMSRAWGSGRGYWPLELSNEHAATFGVMQPTGDRFAGGSIDRIAGSPWMGREWCERANGGQGPLWPEFTHMFVDECLKRTAEKLGVYWMRPDLTHLHRHFMRASDDVNSHAVPRTPPPHLRYWNTREHWVHMENIFRHLESQDFAPCMPLAAVSA